MYNVLTSFYNIFTEEMEKGYPFYRILHVLVVCIVLSGTSVVPLVLDYKSVLRLPMAMEANLELRKTVLIRYL